TLGYGVFVVLMLACARAVWRSPNLDRPIGRQDEKQPQADEAIASGFWSRMRWVAVGVLTAGLVLGGAKHITLDIAGIPLLWIIPLALYLLSFILVFAKWPPAVHRMVVLAMPLVLLVLVFRMLYTVTKWPISATIGLHLLTLFMIALVCHGELARTRPSPRYLTQFYLLMSLGGVLGGLFNALAAPLIFNSVVEYNVALVLACLLLPPPDPDAGGWRAGFFPARLPKPVGAVADVASAALLGLGAFALFLFLLTSPAEDSWRAGLRDGVTPAIDWIK